MYCVFFVHISSWYFCMIQFMYMKTFHVFYVLCLSNWIVWSSDYFDKQTTWRKIETWQRKIIYHALENTSWWHHLEGKWLISLLSAWRQVFISQQLMIFGNMFVVSPGGNYCEPHIMGWWYVRPRRSGTIQSPKIIFYTPQKGFLMHFSNLFKKYTWGQLLCLSLLFIKVKENQNFS